MSSDEQIDVEDVIESTSEVADVVESGSDSGQEQIDAASDDDEVVSESEESEDEKQQEAPQPAAVQAKAAPTPATSGPTQIKPAAASVAAPASSAPVVVSQQEAAESQDDDDVVEINSVCVLSQLRANSVYQHASRVFHWRDPVESGLVFAIVSFFYFLITFGEYSVVTLVSYLLLTGLLVSGLYVNGTLLYAAIKNKQPVHPFRHMIGRPISLSVEDAEPYVELVAILFNGFVSQITELYFCTNNVMSLLFVFVLSIVGGFGTVFSGPTLLFLVSLGFFVWPRLYEEKQSQIDQLVGVALGHVNQVVAQVQSKIPGAKKSTKIE